MINFDEFSTKKNVVMHIVENENLEQNNNQNLKLQSQTLHIAFEDAEEEYNELELLLKEWGLLHLRDKFSSNGPNF